MFTSVFLAVMAVALLLSAGASHQQCTEAMAEEQLSLWNKAYVGNVSWSACGGKVWLSRYYELSTNDVEIIFDIGCNKGYESGLMMSLFKPAAGVSANTLYRVHEAEGRGLEGALCGACGNCNEVVTGTKTRPVQQEVHLYCFEPSLVNFGNLINARNHVLDKLEAENMHWHLINSAVGPKTTMVKFPRNCGSTLCMIKEDAGDGVGAGPQYEAIFATSVTDFARAEGLQRIDVLKIDTEGHDPAVIMGAKRMLQAQRVGLLYFEYNSMSLWVTVKLADIVQALALLDYKCYFEGTPTLTEISGSCWREGYEFRGWSNVVCAHKNHFMAKELENLSWQGQGLLSRRG